MIRRYKYVTQVLFLVYFISPPLFHGSGGKVIRLRLCVFCLQSAGRLFRDEVIVYKSVTPGVRAGAEVVIYYPTQRQGEPD